MFRCFSISSRLSADTVISHMLLVLLNDCYFILYKYELSFDLGKKIKKKKKGGREGEKEKGK